MSSETTHDTDVDGAGEPVLLLLVASGLVVMTAPTALQVIWLIALGVSLALQRQAQRLMDRRASTATDGSAGA